MQQQSKILKINVKMNLQLNLVNMTKNKKNKIHHTKIKSGHASNSLKNGCDTGNKYIITLWLVYADTENQC